MDLQLPQSSIYNQLFNNKKEILNQFAIKIEYGES